MVCRICNRPIVILIRQGSGICCNQCEKIEKGEMSHDEILRFIAEVNPSQYKRVMESINAPKNT